ncbi:MAG: elongation factor G [Oscillospiraceae bacterium]|jgi:elongation factor G
MSLAPEKIRNVMLAGHSSSGKTSLAEALLFETKSSDRFGSVADGNTVMDYDPEEIRRKATISTSVSFYDYKGCRVNLLDAPGLFDFALGAYEAILAADTVLIAVSAHSGVSVGTEKAWDLAEKYGRAKMFYVSKLGAEHSDFDKTMSGLRDVFGDAVCPIVVPLKEEGKPIVYEDLVNKKAYTYKDGKASEVPFDADAVADYLSALREQISETDDALMEKFFNDEPFTKEELVTGIRAAMRTGKLAPVLCGESLTREATDLVLEAINDFAPSPDKAAPTEAVDKDGNKAELPCDPKGPVVVYVFKTVADPFVGKLSYVRVESGVLKADSNLAISTSGVQVKPGKLISLKGKKQIDAQELSAGDIGALSKLSDVKTGDTLCPPDRIITVKPVEFPKATLKMSIYTKNKGDEGKIASAIQKMLEEDRTLSYYINKETGQQILAGLGDQHLDVVASKIKSKFGVDIGLAVPKIAYRETIRKAASAEGKHKKQTGGAGQFGVVDIKFEPMTDGTDFEFVNAVVGGAVPKEFIPAVEKGLREALQHGVLAGYPMVGIKATLYDGKYHPVDSKEVAFKSAARLAYKAACKDAKPCLLEPIDTVKIYVPDSNTGDIMGDVTKRRGRVLGMTPMKAGLQEIDAEIPESELQDFSTYIRSTTQGRGSYEQEFLRYEQVPSNLEQKIIDEADMQEEEE